MQNMTLVVSLENRAHLKDISATVAQQSRLIRSSPDAVSNLDWSQILSEPLRKSGNNVKLYL